MREQYEPIDLSEDIEDITISYAYVVAGPVTDFQRIKRYIENLNTCRLVYMKRSLGHLFITDRNPNYAPRMRGTP